MRPYLSIVRMRFSVQLQYRAAAAAGMFTQFFFGFVRVMVFHAFYASNIAMVPMSLEQAVTYEWMVQITLRMLPWNGDDDIMRMIRSGNVAYELCRPLNLYFSWYSRLLAFRIVPTLLQGIPMFLIAYFLPAGFGVSLPASPVAAGAWLLSTVCALFLGCAVSNIISITTLWTIGGEGARRLIPAFVMFLSGTTVPLIFFPDWTQRSLMILPFSGLVEVPLRFYLGLLPAGQVFGFLLLQLGWTVVIILFGLFLLNTAMKRVVIQGG